MAADLEAEGSIDFFLYNAKVIRKMDSSHNE